MTNKTLINDAEARLFVVSAPTGAGKTSLLKQVISELDSVQTAISHTTRIKRENEVDGIDYHFVNNSIFKSLIKLDAFYEYAEVFSNHYGTSKAAIAEVIFKGIDVILEVDWQGARQIKRQLPNTRSIFILPPSKKALESRLNERGQDMDEVIAKRMNAAISEMSHYDEYDYLVINDDFDTAKEEIKAIIVSERQKLALQQKKHAQLLSDLLE